MILSAPSLMEFDVQRNLFVDTENIGFTEHEVGALAPVPVGGAKGLDSWWRRGRSVPPEFANLQSELGYQTMPLLTDLVAVAEAQNVRITGEISARLARFNFYIMRCGVYIAPAGGETFRAMKFMIRYRGGASTFAMLPGPQAKKILELGGTADVGVTAGIDFGFPDIPLHVASVDAAAKAKLDANFIVSFNYELKTQIVDAFGIGTPFCKWFMHRGDNLRNDVLFYPIIMTPRSVTGFECDFSSFYQIGHANWKNPEFYQAPPMTVAVSA